MKDLVKIRRAKMLSQGGKCFYCGQRMWDKAVNAKDCTTQSRQSKALQCTAEHLCARSDGGSNNPKNIVAACHYCNTTRHKRKNPRSPEDHRAHVRQRMSQGRWFRV